MSIAEFASVSILRGLYDAWWNEVSHASSLADALMKYAVDPLVLNVYICAATAFTCWFLSILTGNSSQVDRIWSITPILYTFIFAVPDLRLLFTSTYDQINFRPLVIFFLVLVWGSRLTYNFARKGGYNYKDEDYRWPVLRQIIPPFFYQIFNITFIATYQNVLLLLITLPAYIAYLARDNVYWQPLDTVATALFVFFLLGETIADQQQWNFQSVKHSNSNPKTGDYARGFLTKGLFKFSRHPNFVCEMSIWWSVYLFSVAVTGEWLNWSILGTVLLTLLFQGSTTFTEYITSKKYPEYAKYKKTTSRLIPWFPGQSLDKKQD